MHLCLTAGGDTAAVELSAIELPAVTQSASSRLLQLEAGTLLANTPVGVYRHQLRAVRERLRLEVARSDQYCADAQLARDQLKAEIDARNSIQVITGLKPIAFHLKATERHLPYGITCHLI